MTVETGKTYLMEDGNFIVIDYDHFATSPREYAESALHIVKESGRTYGLLNNDVAHDSEEDLQEAIEKWLTQNPEGICLPVYLYEHSEFALKVGEPAREFDSKVWGHILGSEHDNTESLKGQIEVLENWLNGQVFCTTIENAEGEMLDGCGGFYSIEDAATSYSPIVREAKMTWS